MSDQTLSYQCKKKYGRSRSEAIHLIQNKWHIPEKCRDILSVYYILYWDKIWLLDNIKDGTITRDGITYIVLFHNCDPATLRKFCDSGVKVSFRVLKPEFDFPPTALITPE